MYSTVNLKLISNFQAPSIDTECYFPLHKASMYSSTITLEDSGWRRNSPDSQGSKPTLWAWGSMTAKVYIPSWRVWRQKYVHPPETSNSVSSPKIFCRLGRSPFLFHYIISSWIFSYLHCSHKTARRFPFSVALFIYLATDIAFWFYIS